MEYVQNYFSLRIPFAIISIMKARKWTTSQLKEAAAKSRSIRQVLLFLGLQPAGGNYDHVKRYLKELKIDTSHFSGKGWNKGN